jgi:catechol 2,3-dioxygenase-like lactoylglutathione lyase family enzyme
MLGSRDAMATVAVKDMNVAKKFYENTLGLKRDSAENSEAITYKAGSSTLLVYRSQYAGTNEATAVTWPVDHDLEEIVQALRAKGVTFERYDLPDTTRKGDVHEAGGTRVAWFKDPDGNIHALVSE